MFGTRRILKKIGSLIEKGVYIYCLTGCNFCCFILILSIYACNRFRMLEEKSYVPRPWAWPQLPWGTLRNPSYVQTATGSKLLTDGWYRYGRKIHYTADVVMALCWGLTCGVTHFLPFYYVCFFTPMLVSRAKRDQERCAKKYGESWKEYMRTVPYDFIPGII